MIKPIAFLPFSLPSPSSLLKFLIGLANYAQVLEARSENGCGFSRPGLETGVKKSIFVFFFPLKEVQNLEKRAAHFHVEFLGVHPLGRKQLVRYSHRLQVPFLGPVA